MLASGRLICGSVLGKGVESPNDPKLSDLGVRRGTCMVGGKAAAEAGAVTHGAVRCSAWLDVAGVAADAITLFQFVERGLKVTEQQWPCAGAVPCRICGDRNVVAVLIHC